MNKDELELLFNKFDEKYDELNILERTIHEYNKVGDENLYVEYKIFKNLESGNIITDVIIKDIDTEKLYKMTTIRDNQTL